MASIEKFGLPRRRKYRGTKENAVGAVASGKIDWNPQDATGKAFRLMTDDERANAKETEDGLLLYKNPPPSSQRRAVLEIFAGSGFGEKKETYSAPANFLEQNLERIILISKASDFHVPFSNGAPAAAIHSGVKPHKLVFEVCHAAPDQEQDQRITPDEGYQVCVEEHVLAEAIERALDKKRASLSRPPIVMFREIKIRDVHQGLVQGGGWVSVYASTKKCAPLRRCGGAMTGHYGGDKKVYSGSKNFVEFSSLTSSGSHTANEEKATKEAQAQIEKLEKENKEVEGKIKAMPSDDNKPDGIARQIKHAYKSKLEDNRKQIEVQKSIIDLCEKNRLERINKENGTVSMKKVVNYLVNEEMRLKINRLAAGIAKDKNSAKGEPLLLATKEVMGKIFDDCGCKDAIELFKLDLFGAIQNATQKNAADLKENSGSREADASKSKNSFPERIRKKIPLAEGFAAVDFDHERHIEFHLFVADNETKKEEERKEEYKLISRTIKSDGTFLMRDPANPVQQRKDPLGLLMLYFAPTLLWEEFMKGKTLDNVDDKKWREFIASRYDVKTGVLKLNRVAFYEKVEEVSRIASLNGTIAPLSCLQLHLVPHRTAVIPRTIHRDGRSVGKRGLFRCKMEVEVIFLGDEFA